MADLGDFARELARNAKALARSINGMYPCRLSEPYLPDIPLYWHERIRMGGRGEGKHSHVTYLSHALLSMIIYDRKRYEFLIHEVLIAPLSASARAAEERSSNFLTNRSKDP